MATGTITSVPILAVLAVVSTAIIWAGSTLLESASEELATYYGLPAIVQGAIIAAVGSSFPELMSVVISTLRYGSFELGVGAIVGSAIFNILVIPAVSGLYVRGPIESSPALVYKEAQFYMLAVSVIVITFALAVIYNPTEGLRGEMTRGLALIPVLLYGLYVFIQYEDVSDTETDETVPETDVGRQWLALVGGLVLIVVAVEGIVRAADGFGAVLGTPEFLWGLTVVAAATSLPDGFVSVKAAQSGEDVTSIANVLGSNTFDLLVAVPTGVLLAGATEINFGVTVPMMGFLTFATVVLFTVLRTDLQLADSESAGLLFVYAVFVVWMVAETLGVLTLLPR